MPMLIVFLYESNYFNIICVGADMFKFQFYRMEEPRGGPTWQSETDSWPQNSFRVRDGISPLLLPVWIYVWDW